MHGTVAGRLRTFADLNFLIVNVRQQLTEVAHVEIRPADRAIAEMIGLRFYGVIGIEAGIARNVGHLFRASFRRSQYLSFRDGYEGQSLVQGQGRKTGFST
jgi:hypothetical protein